MDNYELYTHLQKKIQDIELKLDAIILRLQLCEKHTNKANLQISTSFNPLDQYIEGLKTVSCGPSPINKNEKEQNILSQRWYSQQDQKKISRFKKIEIKENILDSKSFGMIKRSLMINSEEIEEIRDRMIEIEQGYTKRIMDVEQGFEVVARLSQLMQKKIQDIIDQRKQIEDIKKDNQKNKKKSKMKEIISKYQNKNTDKEDLDFIEKYL